MIVPCSGGKDSRYVAHYLKTKYDMNPLTVTWKPHMHTQIGLKNVLYFPIYIKRTMTDTDLQPLMGTTRKS